MRHQKLLQQKGNPVKTVSLSTLFFIILSFLTIGNAFAAVDTDVIQDTAGAEQRRFDEEILREQRDREILKKQVEGEEVLNEVGLTEPKEGEVTFTLKSFDFSGNEEIEVVELQEVVQPFIGREVSLKNLQEIASIVKRHYREAGYIATYVYVPPQNVAHGNVQLAVIEGKVGEIRFENNRWFSDKVLSRMAKLGRGTVILFKDLKNSLDFINKHRDIKAKAVLKPGEEKETTDVEIHVEEDFPVHLSVDVNNLGTKNTGRTRWGVGLSHTNLTGNLDQLSGRFQIGDGALAIGADYSYPINDSGTRVGYSYSFSKTDVGGDFAALDIEGTSHTNTIYALHPFYPTENVASSARLAFDFKDVENTLLDVPSGKDHLRILSLGINNEITDRWGKTYFPHSVHIGFSSFLGASDKVEPAASRAGSGGQFVVYRGSLIRYHRLPKGMMLTLRSRWQFTNDRLAPSEQLRLGGAFSVRGYPEGEYLADYGAYGSAELLVPSYFFPEDWKLPFSEKNLRNQIQGTAFFDFGYGHIRKHLAGETEDRTLAGAGVGVRIHLFDKVFARLQWATPTGSSARNGSETAFYYGISAELI